MAEYTNSSLVDYTKISPNKSSPRNHIIDTITPHCFVGQVSVERAGEVFANPKRQASCNYAIGYDGRIALICDEKDRSWCSGGLDRNGNPIRVNGISGADNDQRAITIEIASDTKPPYKITDEAYEATIKLFADIAIRNGIKEWKWKADKSLVGDIEKQNVSVHRWFANKACLPVDTELLTPTGWKPLSEINIGDKVASASINDLSIEFEPVLDKVEEYRQDTYTNNGLTATKDHRIIYTTSPKKHTYKVDFYNNVLTNTHAHIPCAGYYLGKGIGISENLLKFIVAVQADGHYMYEKTKSKERSYYGVEFHFRKSRKINRLRAILDGLNIPYSNRKRTDGTTAIRIYNYNHINIVEDICEQYLTNKNFNWNLLNLSKAESSVFLSEIIEWDGYTQNHSYFSKVPQNINVVSAVASINGVGSNINDRHDTITFRSNPFITFGQKSIRNNSNSKHPNKNTYVSCVTVRSGFILIRQHGKTFIVGNCPGDYIYEHLSDIVEKANAIIKKKDVDNTPDPWAKEAIDFAVENKLIFGNNYGNMKLHSNCTRQEMIVFLYRYCKRGFI